jgi:uncharacterized protein YaaN involved in tellurite resistance
MSVLRMHGTTRPPNDTDFIRNLIFEPLFENCRENYKLYQNLRTRTDNLHGNLSAYLAELFLDLEILQTKVVQKVKTHIVCLITFSPNPYRL